MPSITYGNPLAERYVDLRDVFAIISEFKFDDLPTHTCICLHNLVCLLGTI